MVGQTPIQLRFGPAVELVARTRIEYAFRTFCALYGHRPIVYAGDTVTDAQGIRLAYGAQRSDTDEIMLPSRYVARSPQTPVPAPKPVPVRQCATYARLGLRETPVFHGEAGDVDWLGEMFEWLSHADEYAVSERDEVGRIPYASSVHGRYHLDPTIPYASIAMLEFANTIGVEPPSSQTRIAATHDLDYLPTGAMANARRLIKNMAVAALVDRDLTLVMQIALAGVRGLIRRRSPLDCINVMLVRESARNIRSSSYVICRQGCARDGNYALSMHAARVWLATLAGAGSELGVHGSYRSLEDGTLAAEVHALRDQGFDVQGTRAHWIRYTGDKLYNAIEAIGGMAYDSTVSFVDRVGFRSGASFIYRPYRFATESAYSFFEVPLAVMDGALRTHARHVRARPKQLCDRVLDMVDAFPAGGVSVLWHNTVFEDAQLPHAVGKVYWDLPRPNQRWMRAIDVVSGYRESYSYAFDEAAGEPLPC
jgi:hypothetical protein